MSILEDLTALLPVLDVPMETGVFSNMAPDQYLVIVPLSDSFDLHADNEPGIDIQEARLSLYSKGSYTAVKNRLVRLLVQNGYTITDRQYLGFTASGNTVRLQMSPGGHLNGQMYLPGDETRSVTVESTGTTIFTFRKGRL